VEVVEAAVADTAVGVEATAAMVATATAEEVMEGEPVDTVAAAVTVDDLHHAVPLHLITAEVVVEDDPGGTIGHVQDPILLVSIHVKCFNEN
jgi:hypothetical protein